MQQHSDFYTFAVNFWWLIFPVGLGLAGIMGVWLRHKRAQKALELLISYAQQNREPPAEVLALLQTDRRHGQTGNPAHKYWAGGLFFAALAIGFLALLIGRVNGDDHSKNVGLLFVSIVIAGFSVSMFTLAWLTQRNKTALPPP